MILGSAPTEFIRRVCQQFGLGQAVSVGSLPRSGNLVWAVRTSTGYFVVKELPTERLSDLVAASGFEQDAFDARVVPMAEPLPDAEGALIRRLCGSRGRLVCVRVHRYVAGTSLRRPIDPQTAQRAGEVLATLQGFAPSADREASLPVRIWRRHDRRLFGEFVDTFSIASGIAQAGSQCLLRAERLIDDWAEQGRSLQAVHGDHKPENALLSNGELIILDWDEVSACDPRIEAVESGLRWAWTDDRPDPGLFAAFAAGYRGTGRALGLIRESDWAKWVAGIGSWFEFQARGALGGWSAVSGPRSDAYRGALDTLRHLADTLDQLPDRTALLNDALRRHT